MIWWCPCYLTVPQARKKYLRQDMAQRIKAKEAELARKQQEAGKPGIDEKSYCCMVQKSGDHQYDMEIYGEYPMIYKVLYTIPGGSLGISDPSTAGMDIFHPPHRWPPRWLKYGRRRWMPGCGSPGEVTRGPHGWWQGQWLVDSDACFAKESGVLWWWRLIVWVVYQWND